MLYAKRVSTAFEFTRHVHTYEYRSTARLKTSLRHHHSLPRRRQYVTTCSNSIMILKEERQLLATKESQNRFSIKMAQALHVDYCSLLLLLSIALGVALPVVECAPYFMLTNTRPKCFTVEGPRATTLTVSYYAPDMVLLPEDDSEVVAENAPDQNNKENAGLDERFNRRFQDKMRALQRAGKTLTDVSIVVYQKGETVSSARERSATTGGGRVREELTTRKGSLEYTTSLSRDAPVEICVQSMAAQLKSPERMSLIVSRHVKITKEQKEEQERQAQQHMSAISGELMQLDRKVEMILSGP